MTRTRRHGAYGAILADPPWHEKTYSNKGMGRSAMAHYDVMSLEEICALGDQVKGLAARDCALLLWVTWPMLMHAQQVIEAWGFHYSSNAWTWIKQTKDGAGLRMMGGHTTRKCTEVCLLGLRGNPKRLSMGVKDVIFAPWREPHRKPDEQYAKVEMLYPGPYVELFARRRWPGWDVALSNQADCIFSGLGIASLGEVRIQGIGAPLAHPSAELFRSCPYAQAFQKD